MQKNKGVEDNNGHKDDESANRLYDDNEEEESEDEDGDLSKYDLWGSDEENDKKKEDKSSNKGFFLINFDFYKFLNILKFTFSSFY